MAAASASIFDQINTGDILSNIGNEYNGMSPKEVSEMVIGVAMAQSNAEREAAVNDQQERERRFIIAASTSIGLGLFLFIIYLISLKQKKS
jgi:hypothetical protein